MGDWAKQIVNTDFEKEPEQLEGMFITLAPGLLFESINAQLDIAKESGDAKLVFIALLECIACMGEFQRFQFEMFKSNSLFFFIVGKLDDLPLEYILAVINNNSRCYE